MTVRIDPLKTKRIAEISCGEARWRTAFKSNQHVLSVESIQINRLIVAFCYEKTRKKVSWQFCERVWKPEKSHMHILNKGSRHDVAGAKSEC